MEPPLHLSTSLLVFRVGFCVSLYLVFSFTVLLSTTSYDVFSPQKLFPAVEYPLIKCITLSPGYVEYIYGDFPDSYPCKYIVNKLYNWS